ncbi:hypothetical protein DENSPDRAFT_841580 [Dentipellis sp. KUC8613]|nr:hypothetical protein DENSPDRAFT_841580 [Dentipellis sp. KUC8613]
MSEQDPLLDQSDPEAAEAPRGRKWRTRVAEALESSAVHKLVIALTILDAGFVLADLSYTLLSPGCEPPSGPDSLVWLEVLSELSTAITTIFLIEIPLSLWSLGFNYYNPWGEVPHSSLHLFDASIILVTFILEVILRGKERELASLLIVLRLWRLIKLVGGVAVSTGEIEDEDIKELAQTKRELDQARSALSEAQLENQKLRMRLASFESEGDN